MKKPLSKGFLGILITLSLAYSCGGSSGSEEPPKKNEVLPTKAIGTLPVNGEPCADYDVVEGDNSKVSVLFAWNSAQNVDSYLLEIKESTNQVFSRSFTSLSTNVELNRGKTYSWALTSINSDGQTKGDSYSFSTPGNPQGNYAPYTADITVTFDANSNLMYVSWIGSDEDGDELIYDITILEKENLILDIKEFNGMQIDPISYVSNEEYTIQVDSKDTFGNVSISITSLVAPN
ncbi:hypothetical protein [Flagellimonas beolgyonensis]|uniref:hypothetical protein n=1 Tax=Flagellimonas beolgyonensis TaxID=864064 RepID=UPI000F8C95C7|nr:hypothetical protein [Allomuricauda beolgyonensis]